MSETSAGEMRPEDVPDELVQAAADAIHAHYAAHPEDESEDNAIRTLLAAALTKLGLREEWGYRWGADDDDLGSRAEGYDTEADARIGAHPSETIMRRYVTDWEDVDA